MKLGEQFPPDDQLAFIRRSLRPGAILYLDCAFTNPPKNKYGILVCTDPEPLVFLVNSRINRWLAERPALRDCQITLHQCDYPFLQHDSCIDCTTPYRFLTVEAIERQLMNDIDRQITESEQQAILYAVESGKTIEQRITRWILDALHP